MKRILVLTETANPESDVLKKVIELLHSMTQNEAQFIFIDTGFKCGSSAKLMLGLMLRWFKCDEKIFITCRVQFSVNIVVSYVFFGLIY